MADAYLLLAGGLLSRLGVEQLVDDTVRMGGRAGGGRPGRKMLSLVASMPLGGTHIDHADRLRSAATRRVLPFWVMAPFHVGNVSSFFHMGSCLRVDQGPGTAFGPGLVHTGGPPWAGSFMFTGVVSQVAACVLSLPLDRERLPRQSLGECVGVCRQDW